MPAGGDVWALAADTAKVKSNVAMQRILLFTR
jgi:hypothetical protein